ncbi:MAG TPA: ECF-type sigma factor [Longimicrobiales bacterium]|nr:ECF-type sigma factor [Longimicrobiales bacterium]
MTAPTNPSAAFTSPGDGDRRSLDRLVPLLYQQLRVIAHRELGRHPRGGTIETSELVHEAYLKVIGRTGRAGGAAPDEAHFLALASVAMRHVLVDRARARGRLKRGGGHSRVTLDEDRIAVDDQPEALLQLDEALTWLAGLEPRLARVVECRFFGGMGEEQIAAALGVTVRTVQRDWAKARMLLRRALEA